MSAAVMVNWIIAKIFGFGFGAYEMSFDAQKELDVVKRSTADKNDVDAGIITRDESRISRGLERSDCAGGIPFVALTGEHPLYRRTPWWADNVRAIHDLTTDEVAWKAASWTARAWAEEIAQQHQIEHVATMRRLAAANLAK